mmetsp:Transcript_38049/g.77718  ORF Transcript_38049/g.77718 Transcript_38049/m.77718 type:complete len:80 (+) Transcript_38049:777-1016(+)
MKECGAFVLWQQRCGVLFPALLFCNFGLWTLAPFVQLVERFRRFASFSVHCELDIKAAVVVSAELDKDERVNRSQLQLE